MPNTEKIISDLKRKITGLEYDKQLLQDHVLLLKRDNQALIRDKKTLKDFLKRNKVVVYEFTRQGFRYDYADWGWHYVVIPIEGIPLSLGIIDVKELIENALKELLAKGGIYSEYEIRHFDYSERKNLWYVQIEKMIDTKLDQVTNGAE